MKLQIKIISIFITALFVLTFIPIYASPVSRDYIRNVSIQNDNFSKINENLNTVKIRVINIKEDGTFEKTIKTITREQQKTLWEELKNIDDLDLSLLETFESKLQVLKDYKLVSSDLKLEQIMDVNKLNKRYEKVDGENFEVDYAPLLFAGGGIGFGFGIPFFITSGTFLCMLFGFGLTLCLDVLNGILYQLITFFFIPMLVGYLGGFVGLLLLPVIPGFFYSNFFGMGFATKTSWMMIPATNYSAV